MYRRLLEEYLTHYQPELMAELLQTQTLQSYLDETVEAMEEAKREILAKMAKHSPPEMSQMQRSIEADQYVREMFMPVS